MQNLARY